MEGANTWLRALQKLLYCALCRGTIGEGQKNTLSCARLQNRAGEGWARSPVFWGGIFRDAQGRCLEPRAP